MADLLGMELVLSAEEALRSVIAQDFETVIIFGFKDNSVYTRVSGRKDALKIIGALEVAKRALWDSLEDAD